MGLGFERSRALESRRNIVALARLECVTLIEARGNHQTPEAGVSATIKLHKNDLPASVSFAGSVAIDTETLGLKPRRDRLCLVQLSAGDGSAHLVQLDGKDWSAPRLKALL